MDCDLAWVQIALAVPVPPRKAYSEPPPTIVPVKLKVAAIDPLVFAVAV
jgi:hypothetical protein